MENFYKILFRYNNIEEDRQDIEGAWASKVGSYYKLDNILFYAKEYSLGDIVEVEEENGELYVTGLHEESGHSTVRIYFNNVDQVAHVREELKKMGCASEISNIPKLISVDIPPDVDYQEIKKYLDVEEAKEQWDYEEACIAYR